MQVLAEEDLRRVSSSFISVVELRIMAMLMESMSVTRQAMECSMSRRTGKCGVYCCEYLSEGIPLETYE